ncbi:helix-turn-helix domain-containing protein [candidate division WS5 bacterium]|uniref:Helix-turn-helix domain-containing protein n=1 Tax=candidate division WS5 bacterium TaxID=2093353 RepID=A0A419D9V1_9BACT|nr:MAG: helix-turn-helix domain-containing protein [candidate division WS5 bacterium]
MISELITCRELSRRLGLNQFFIYKLCRERRIPAIRIGKVIRFDWVKIEAWVKKNEISERS